ncbi:hypothetical protein F3Y22_tig00015498pilonHSYRG00063 [Hibiscus syriacus]|uniref:BZIP domain-containing protein n=1 Tax=Hibiscus syriacus TaxID=106335 RepID=A0A6A3BXL7_HIBSY|nr:hypothetical protein F3Y22_tig00015498pilonHSYRG00063 [Hibiscus syriacus]
MTLEDFLVKAGVVSEASINVNAGTSVGGVDLGLLLSLRGKVSGLGMTHKYTSKEDMRWSGVSEVNINCPYKESLIVGLRIMWVEGAGTQPLRMPYPQPQYYHPQQSIMGVYMPPQPMSQPLVLGTAAIMDVSFPENQVQLHSPLMGSDTQASGRKRARSRARKQAYTNELENKVSLLEEENERLRKRKVRSIF